MTSRNLAVIRWTDCANMRTITAINRSQIDKLTVIEMPEAVQLG